MLRKRWGMIAIVLLILLCAFLFPYVMLRVEQANATETVLVTGEGRELNPEQMRLSEKLSLVANESLTVIDDVMRPPEDVALKFCAQLDVLHECGALSGMEYHIASELFSEASNVVSHIAYDEIEELYFRYYWIRSDYAEAFAIFDADSGKIMCLGLPVNEQGVETVDLNAQLRAWANYFGMNVSDVQILDTNKAAQETAIFGCCEMYDETGERFAFGFGRSPEKKNMYWSSIPETVLMQEGY